MEATYYVCKYTPVELLAALGANPVSLDAMRDDFERADQVVGTSICGFGKTVIEAVFDGNVKELVLVNCCDTIRSVYDVLLASGKLDFLFLLDLPHSDDACSRDRTVEELHRLSRAYAAYRGMAFDIDVFKSSFAPERRLVGPHVKVLGARMGDALFEEVCREVPFPVQNATCVHSRTVGEGTMPETRDVDELFAWYAAELTGQVPCMRMKDPIGRRRLYNDPDMIGVIYHTIRFCDFYSFEYAEMKSALTVPLVKIETDYTTQSTGQLDTRLDAFAESLRAGQEPLWGKERDVSEGSTGYFAGIDSGSTSTDVAIVDAAGNLVASAIVSTGASASISADEAFDQALCGLGFTREDIGRVVATGYGRATIELGDKQITEITCHARGAHYLDPSVRSIIDIGGQDSKVIDVDEAGDVVNFTMNDKCAAGTGRFLDTMARTLDMSLDELSKRGMTYREDITISSMCTVFAESEVVGLRAQNKAVDDIVHGLDNAVATKTVTLAKRVGAKPPYMMTGGVSKNDGLVAALEAKLGEPLIIHKHAQLCGAIGAALFAAGL